MKATLDTCIQETSPLPFPKLSHINEAAFIHLLYCTSAPLLCPSENGTGMQFYQRIVCGCRIATPVHGKDCSLGSFCYLALIRAWTCPYPCARCFLSPLWVGLGHALRTWWRRELLRVSLWPHWLMCISEAKMCPSGGRGLQIM